MTTTSTGTTAGVGVSPAPGHGASERRATWALWGAAAGVCGVLTNMVLAPSVEEPLRTSADSAGIVAELSRSGYHVSAVTGFLAVVCLLAFAAGFVRWGRAQASGSLALLVAPLGLVASAGALIAAYGVKGQLAAYLTGGFNDGTYGPEQLHVFFLLDDLSGYVGWFGVAVTAGALAVLAFRERLVPRWVGALGALVALAVGAFLVAFGFTGFAGVVSPVFLVVAGLGLSRMRG